MVLVQLETNETLTILNQTKNDSNPLEYRAVVNIKDDIFLVSISTDLNVYFFNLQSNQFAQIGSVYTGVPLIRDVQLIGNSVLFCGDDPYFYIYDININLSTENVTSNDFFHQKTIDFRSAEFGPVVTDLVYSLVLSNDLSHLFIQQYIGGHASLLYSVTPSKLISLCHKKNIKFFIKNTRKITL